MSETEALQPIDPHQHIKPQSTQESFLKQLLERLWLDYRDRVSYVQAYEQVVQKAGASFENDHVAFRTIAWQRPSMGVDNLSRIFQAAGYAKEGVYEFPDKRLSAIHLRHSNDQFPKIFISEFKAWEMNAEIRDAIGRTVSEHRPHFSDAQLAGLFALNDGDESLVSVLVDSAAAVFLAMPWDVPERADLIAVSKVSQYAAWVMAHGYRVNHFTALVNSHKSDALSDIEKTVAAMIAAGVPTKETIEGEPGSRLRQTATEAVEVEVEVRDGVEVTTIPWNYAYFEIAERGEVIDPATGEPVRFEGFLGPQATHLFDMTARPDQR